MILRYPVDRRDLSEEDYRILKAVRLYYEHDLTQAQVASRMGFSRPTVSRLLAEGRARGFVKIEVAEPTGEALPMEIALEDRYGLAEARVVHAAEDRRATELVAGMAGGAVLASLCDRSTVLGVAWGISLRALADALPHRAFECAAVVSLVGGIGRTEANLHSSGVCATLSEKLGVEARYLSAPAIAPSRASRDELMGMPGIREVVAEGAACDVAVVGIGGILPTSTLIGAGYFSREEFLALGDRGAVGDVLFHFVDADGEPCLPELSARVVGLDPEQLREIPRVVGIATGAEKAPSVAAVLRGGFVSTLVCDMELASGLLEV